MIGSDYRIRGTTIFGDVCGFGVREDGWMCRCGSREK
jgi:hypothetical protein